MKYKIIGFFFFISFCSGVFAQTKTITGQVKDANDNSPLPGVAILIKNTSVGTETGSLGEFSMNASESDTLIFALVGKKEVREFVGQKSVFKIVMEDEGQLDELVVVGFGTQKKSSLVSSITTVKPSELRVAAYNLTSSFAGKIPGMISYQTSGEPGEDLAQFFVRGVTTFGYTPSPLILIDGFESSTYELARLQVDDIESFSILKDASAAALYGARGANGVLLIVTKSGKSGNGTSINVRVDTHIATPTKMIETVNAIDYMNLYNEGVTTRNPLAGKYYSEQVIQSTMNNENPMIYPNIDWYNELFKQTTINKRANLNLSGGGNVARFYVSGGFENENGLLKEDSRNNFNSNISINRVHMRSNVIFNITKTTVLDTRIQAEFERYNGPYNSAASIFNMVMDVNPVDFPPVYEPDEEHKFYNHTLFGNTIVNGVLKNNPYAEMVRGYLSRNVNIVTMIATVQQDFDFLVKGLKFEGKGSVKSNGTSTQTRTFNPFYYSVEQYNQVTQEYKLFGLNRLDGNNSMGDIAASNERGASYYFEGRLNWSGRFGVHNAGAMLVSTLQEQSNLIAGTVFSAMPARNAGVSGRATYDYDNRYFGEFNFGYNGSEKFTKEKRFGFFPSIGVAWMTSNEKFWEPAKDVVNLLKFRVTYGKNGSDAIAGAADRFNFLSQINKGGAPYFWGLLSNTTGGGYTIGRYANANISWEVSRKINIGLDLEALNKVLKFQIDLWKDYRSDIYQQRETFAVATGLIDGDLKIFGNVGKAETVGFESSLDVEKSFANGAWLLGRFNFTYSKNKVTQKDEQQFRDKYLSSIGQSANVLRGLVAERLFVDDYEKENSPRQDWGDYQAGDIKYKDINGDKRINDNDRVPMGFPVVPEIQYGFGLSGGIHNFDVSFFFQGNRRVSFFIDPGKDPVNGEYGIAPLVNHRNALEIVARDYWTETNPNVHAFWPRLSTIPLANNTQESSWWLRDGSFLRLKSVEVGYNIKGINKLLLQSGRIYFSVENVLYFSSFKLWDPEMGSSGRGYPPNRRFNIGLLLQF